MNREKQSSVEAWLGKVLEISKASANEQAIKKTAKEAVELNAPLPLIIPVCTPVVNIEQLGKNGATRELVPLEADNPRLLGFIQELHLFHLMAKQKLGVPIEVMLLLADIPEPGDENLLGDRNSIADQSAKAIKQAFADFDQQQIFQKTGFRTPRVRRLSQTVNQGGKVELNHSQIMKTVELASLHPLSPVFALFVKHLMSAPDWIEDTGFQTVKTSRATWERIRFLLCQAVADTAVLPRLMQVLNKKNQLPQPIIVCATTRKAGIEVQIDAADLLAVHPEIFPKGIAQPGTLAVFKNTGSWTSPISE